MAQQIEQDFGIWTIPPAEIDQWSMEMKQQIDTMRECFVNLTCLKDKEYEAARDEMIRVKNWIDEAVRRTEFADGVSHLKTRHDYDGLIAKIDMAIHNVYGLHLFEIIKPNRKRQMVRARTCWAWFLRKLTAMSLEAIGRTLNRDHATIMHCVKNLEIWYQADRDFRRDARGVMHFLNEAGVSGVNEWEQRLDKGIVRVKKFS
jgi:hypothetical protein